MSTVQGYYTPYRTSNDIILYLSPKQPTPSSVPFELQSYIPPETWATRVPTIARTAGRYSKPLFERIWFALAILSSIVLPIAIYQIFINRIGVSRMTENQYFAIRMVSSLLFLGLGLLFLAPVAIWKYIGKRHVDLMIRQWAKADRLTLGINAQLPIWRVVTPSVFRDTITLTITPPGESAPTSFHPDAYIPSYINGPSDKGAAYSYPSLGEKSGPMMTNVGNVPLYMGDEKRSYSRGFDDVKV